MMFARLKLAEAEGAILAHATRLPGLVLPKGAVLTAAALRALADAGHGDVVAARMEPGDVAEDAAAARLAAALLGPAMIANRPAHGRANIVAQVAGLFRADAGAIDALNQVDEGLTIATLPDATPVRPGTLLVTVKIIPFAVPGCVLSRAESLAAAAPALRLPHFRTLRTGLVLTELPGLKQSVLDGAVEATQARIAALGGTLMAPVRAPHEAAGIGAALRGLLAAGAELLLVAGAAATVDRLDEAPSGLVCAGGTVTQFGMPVDPGNLICLGEVGGIPALILPGCARSPGLNGIDLVLRRIFAGEPVARGDIAGMGVGGLLKDFVARPAPRAMTTAHQGNAHQEKAPPGVAAVILAAGLSSRMAPANKLLSRDKAGKPMVARVAAAVRASRARPAVVVLGHEAEAVRAALAGQDVTFVQAPDYAAGLSASLRAGLAAVPDTAAAAVICLGDMPLVTPADIDALLDAHDPDEGRLIVVPTHRGKRGNPVLWDRRFFPAMSALTGDTGARALLLRHADAVAEIELDSDGILQDFDTAESLAQAEDGLPAAS